MVGLWLLLSQSKLGPTRWDRHVMLDCVTASFESNPFRSRQNLRRTEGVERETDSNAQYT